MTCLDALSKILGAAQLYSLQRFSFRRLQGAHNLSQKRCKKLSYHLYALISHTYCQSLIYFSYSPFVLQLTTLDSTKTLDELKLCPQETVILEERHEDSD